MQMVAPCRLAVFLNRDVNIEKSFSVFLNDYSLTITF